MHRAADIGAGTGALHPLLDHVIRRCPLLPSEIARIEQHLNHLLDAPEPEQLVALFAGELHRRSPAARQQVTDQVRDALCSIPTVPAPAEDWREECRRVATQLADGLLRLLGRRALGSALYAVTNRVLGLHGVQALQWAQHAQAAGGLLAQDAWFPWLRWVCQLPLPSLREGGWLEPLIAALPTAVHRVTGGVGNAHDMLQQTLAPTSPTRLMLLSTVWLLWTRRHAATGGIAPASAAGRRVADLPQRLEQLDDIGRAARRLFAAPAAAADPCTVGHLHAVVPIAAAAAGLLPAHAGGPRGAVPMAAAGLALVGLAQAGTAPGAIGAQRDRRALIDALWSLWDTARPDAPVQLAECSFAPPVDGDHAAWRARVREQLVSLYQHDDFVGALYTERVPPGTLRIRNATLIGSRVNTEVSVQLHPLREPNASAPWSTATATALAQLQATVAEAGGRYDPGHSRLDGVLHWLLGEPPAAVNATAGVLAGLVQRLEDALPDAPEDTNAGESSVLAWLHGQVLLAKSSPVRGLLPAWAATRPDPRSHLGHNLRLARGVLLRLSAHPAMQVLCTAHGADPDRLEFPAHGPVTALRRSDNRSVTLFQAEHPPRCAGRADRRAARTGGAAARAGALRRHTAGA